MPLRAGIDGCHLQTQGYRLVLVLLEQLGQPGAPLELVARRAVEVGRELGECSELAVLGEVEPHLARDLPHGLGLRVAAHARDADAHVERWPLAGVEQVGLKVDLPVGDGDHVGGDEGGDVVGLGLDHGERRQRAASIGLAHLGRALEQAGVEIEHVAGVGLAARRPAQVQRELAVSPCLLREVVIAAERLLSLLHEVLPHRAACVRSDEVQ